MSAMNRKYGAQGLVIVAINVDKKREDAIRRSDRALTSAIESAEMPAFCRAAHTPASVRRARGEISRMAVIATADDQHVFAAVDRVETGRRGRLFRRRCLRRRGDGRRGEERNRSSGCGEMTIHSHANCTSYSCAPTLAADVGNAAAVPPRRGSNSRGPVDTTQPDAH